MAWRSNCWCHYHCHHNDCYCGGAIRWRRALRLMRSRQSANLVPASCWRHSSSTATTIRTLLSLLSVVPFHEFPEWLRLVVCRSVLLSLNEAKASPRREQPVSRSFTYVRLLHSVVLSHLLVDRCGVAKSHSVGGATVSDAVIAGAATAFLTSWRSFGGKTKARRMEREWVTLYKWVG